MRCGVPASAIPEIQKSKILRFHFLISLAPPFGGAIFRPYYYIP